MSTEDLRAQFENLFTNTTIKRPSQTMEGGEMQYTPVEAKAGGLGHGLPSITVPRSKDGTPVCFNPHKLPAEINIEDVASKQDISIPLGQLTKERTAAIYKEVQKLGEQQGLIDSRDLAPYAVRAFAAEGARLVKEAAGRQPIAPPAPSLFQQLPPMAPVKPPAARPFVPPQPAVVAPQASEPPPVVQIAPARPLRKLAVQAGEFGVIQSHWVDIIDVPEKRTLSLIGNRETMTWSPEKLESAFWVRVDDNPEALLVMATGMIIPLGNDEIHVLLVQERRSD